MFMGKDNEEENANKNVLSKIETRTPMSILTLKLFTIDSF